MELLQLITSLIGVIGLILLLLYALMKLNKRVSVTSGSKMRILDRVNVGRESMLLVVAVSGKLMVLGVTGSHIEKICDLDCTEDGYLSKDEASGQINNSFMDCLVNVVSGKMKKGSGDKSNSDKDIEKDDEDSQETFH